MRGFLKSLASAQHATGDTAAAAETQTRAIAACADGFAHQPTLDALNDRLRTYQAALGPGRQLLDRPGIAGDDFPITLIVRTCALSA